MSTAAARIAPQPVQAAALVPPGPSLPLAARLLPERWRGRLGYGLPLWRDPLGFLERVRRECGDVACFSGGKVWLLTHPDHVRHVLQDNHFNYVKGPRYESVRQVMGNGLLASDGATWRSHRRLVQPAFQRRRHAALAPVIASCVERAHLRWNRHAAARTPLDIREELVHLTLDVLLRVLFGNDDAARLPELAEDILVLERHLHGIAGAFLPLRAPTWLLTPGRARFRRALRRLDATVAAMIAQRRAEPPRPDDLLSALVHARDEETGAALSDREIRDEVVTMIQAGHDTFSDAMAWTWILLAQDPEARERAHDEVAALPEGVERDPAAAEQLPFTLRAFQEAMRLYPPGWVLARTAVEDDLVGGFRVRAGSLVVLSPWITHRLPEYWPAPERFDPDRFTPERSAGRPKYAWFPFGGGPRACIGSTLAMLEAQVILAMTARRFRLDLAAPAPRPRPRISLNPGGPVWMTASHVLR